MPIGMQYGEIIAYNIAVDQSVCKTLVADYYYHTIKSYTVGLNEIVPPMLRTLTIIIVHAMHQQVYC